MEVAGAATGRENNGAVRGFLLYCSSNTTLTNILLFPFLLSRPLVRRSLVPSRILCFSEIKSLVSIRTIACFCCCITLSTSHSLCWSGTYFWCSVIALNKRTLQGPAAGIWSEDSSGKQTVGADVEEHGHNASNSHVLAHVPESGLNNSSLFLPNSKKGNLIKPPHFHHKLDY